MMYSTPERENSLYHREHSIMHDRELAQYIVRRSKYRKRDEPLYMFGDDSYNELYTTVHRDENKSLHHDTEPSLIRCGEEKWYCHGVLHRENGPAKVKQIGIRYTINEWYFNGQRHRDNGPAIEIEGSIYEEWYNYGVLHREKDKPAIIDTNRSEWWINGERHRENGPAVIGIDTEEWWKNGELHREDGPAIIKPGYKAWYINGDLHRNQDVNQGGGPAIERMSHHGYISSRCEWYLNGELHREDGPAMEFFNGYKEWWLYNHMLSEKEHRSILILKKFRQKVKSLLISNWYKLYLLTKTRAFCEWYYHPDNIGGKIAKERLSQFTTNITNE